jgi:hypothetical protein
MTIRNPLREARNARPCNPKGEINKNNGRICARTGHEEDLFCNNLNILIFSLLEAIGASRGMSQNIHYFGVSTIYWRKITLLRVH